ncbi:hypothetical protein CRG98_045505, partial [Punica granatum]
FADPARSCILQPCRVCSPLRVYFSASKVRRVCSLVPLATLTGLLTHASLLFGFASSPTLLARASCNLAVSAHPCEFTFLLRKFVEPARLCLIQSCRLCSPVRVYFSASKVRRVCSLVPLATLTGLLTRASLLFCFASSPSLLPRASCNLAGSTHPCEFTFRFASSPTLLARASCNLAGSPSLLACASYNLAGSAHPCEFTFRLRKFADPARSCLLQPCRFCSLVRVYFSASQVHRACSLVPIATLPGLLTRASLIFLFASSPSLLVRASCNLAGSAHPSEFTFLLRKFAEPARLCLIQSCRLCSPVRVYFSASQVRGPCSLVPLATLPVLLTCASLLFRFASSPSLLPRAYCNLAGPAHPCELNFPLRKFAEPARSCLLQPCRVCSPERVYFSASQVRRACSLVPHTILPALLTRASLLFGFASSRTLLARASCNLAVRRACSFVPLATLPGLLTRASLLFCFASSPSLLACASYNLAGSAHPCEFTFRLRKFADPARSCLLQPCRFCSLVRVYFSASQVHRACSLVPIATLPGLLTRASLIFLFASSPSLLVRASCNLAGSAHPSEFTFLLRKFAEPARLCLIQSCRLCSPVRVYFSASQVRGPCSLVPLATLPVLLTCASLLFRFASSPSLLPRAYCNLAGPAHPCELNFPLRKFAEPARSCLLQPCRVCSPERVYFSASQVRRACSLVPHTILPALLTRASLLFGFASSRTLLARASCNLAVRRACSFVPLATLPGLLTRASLLFCFASSPSLLACASYNLAGSAHPCEFTFRLRKFADPARSCLLQPCRFCSLVRVYFSASQVHRACSLVPIATLPGLLTRASLIFLFASSPSLLVRASCNLAGSAHPSEFTFLLRKFAEPARLCLIQSCRLCSPVRVYFSASQVRGPCSLVPLATLPVLLTCASLLFRFASSPSLLPRAYCNLAGPAHPCELNFPLRKFAEPARSCLLQPCRVCSPERVYFSASQVRRACSLVPHTILPALLTRASLLFGFASSRTLLARASCNLAGSAHLCEFTFPLRKFTEPAPSCLLQPCRACYPVRVYFSLRKFADPARSCILQPCH